MKSTRTPLLLISGSLVITTTVMGLSAYLTSSGTYSQTFRMASGSDSGIALTGNDYPSDIPISPNEIFDLKPTVTNTGIMDSYLFAEVPVPGKFTVIDGIDPTWTPLSPDSNVYYYGSEEGLEPFSSGDQSTLFGSVQVNDLASLPENPEDRTISVTGYAIQTVGYNPANPDAVFADAKGE